MANQTVKDAMTIKGTNPQYLVEKIIRYGGVEFFLIIMSSGLEFTTQSTGKKIASL